MTSVLDQTYNDIEYIVIDGGSTDGSKEYIETHKDSLAYWVSEPDTGIYNAMNKGIDKATGSYLLFLNSGDWFVDKHVIKKFISFNPKEDIVYGDPLVMVNGSLKRKYMSSKMNVAKALTHTITHQCIFYKHTIFQGNNKYDTDYKIVADWVLTTEAIIYKNASTKYINTPICVYDLEGISSDKKARIAEREKFLESHLNVVSKKLLRDYSILKNEYDYLNNRLLVKWALLIHRMKGKLFK